MVNKSRNPGLVGQYIRKRRETMGLSQRGLGLLFNPPVTTQFISNVERGVTPLPPVHVPTLAQALQVSETELMSLLEREYTLKLSGRLGKADGTAPSNPIRTHLSILEGDIDFMRNLYDAYRRSDDQTRQAFLTVCESILKISPVKNA